MIIWKVRILHYTVLLQFWNKRPVSSLLEIRACSREIYDQHSHLFFVWVGVLESPRPPLLHSMTSVRPCPNTLA